MATGRSSPAGGLNISGYEIQSKIGEGGMGTVWRAIQLSTHRPVALKLLNEAMFGSEHARLRFQREVELTARLTHAHIARIYDSGLQQGVYFYAMELVDGKPLDTHISDHKLNQRQSLELFAVICRAVQHAHDRGIIHRDLKPSNILVTPDGQPRILDFGLAKSTDFQQGVSLDGDIAGTPAYMSPEQAAGRALELDARTDVYSLGAILYVLLTGQHPHDVTGSKVYVLRRIIEEDVPRPPATLGRDLEAILLKALSRAPAGRYRCAGEMASDIECYLRGEPTIARPATVLYSIRRFARKHRAKLAFALGLIVIAATLGYLAVYRGHTQRVSLLDRELQAGLDAKELPVARLEELEVTASRLESLSRAHADARRRLHQRFADVILRDIQRKVLEEAEIQQITARIAELERRAPDLVPRVRKELADRQGLWQPVFDLRPPFDGLEKVFAPQRVVRGDKDLKVSNPDIGWAVLSTSKCDSTSQMEVEFPWDSAAASKPVGLLLNGNGEAGYAFVVGAAGLEIRRDNIVLISRGLRQPPRDGQPIRLAAWRTGDRLGLQMTGEPILQCDDIFPLNSRAHGHFGLWVGRPWSISQLRGSRQTTALIPSPLEKGDAYYTTGQFNQAIVEYDAQLSSGDARYSQEAKFKKALCFINISQTSQAMDLLGQLTEVPGDRWPRLAEFQLCLVHLQRREIAQANLMFLRLDSQCQSKEEWERLASVVPADWRANVANIYKQQFLGFYANGQYDELLVEHFDSLCRCIDLLSPDMYYRAQKYCMLMAVLNRACKFDLTIRAAQAAFARGDVGTDIAGQIQLYYSDAMRLSGRSADLLGEIDSRLPPRDRAEPYRDKDNGNRLVLLRECARARIALGDWTAAEKDMEDLFRLVPPELFPEWGRWSMTCLLRGYIHQHRLDREGAQAAWRLGVFKSQRNPAHGQCPALETLTNSGVSHLLPAAILGGLTGEWTPFEAEVCWAALLNRLSQGGDSPLGFLATSLINIPKPLVYEIWATPKGLELAGHVALADLKTPELERELLALIATEFFRQDSFKRPLDQNEAALIRQFTDGYYDWWRSGKAGKSQILQLGAVWTLGITNRMGWGGLVPQFPPKLRALTAYVVASHWAALKDRDNATFFFKEAIENASGNAALESCARQGLQRLQDVSPGAVSPGAVKP